MPPAHVVPKMMTHQNTILKAHKTYTGQAWVTYRIAEKFGRGNFVEFGELSVIHQTKTIQINTINNLLADLLIRQIFFRQMLEKSQFTNLSPHQTFPLYSMTHVIAGEQQA